MSDVIRLVDYYYVQVPDEPGEGAKTLRALKDAGVNLLAFSGFPSGRHAQLDFVPADAAAFKGVAKRNKWRLVGPKRGFLMQGDDRVGAIADVVGKLAAAKVDITAIAGPGRRIAPSLLAVGDVAGVKGAPPGLVAPR